MNLIKFPVATTNVFPMANSSHGGQLTTEFNLRSRESVGTTSSVKYIIGPSYTHSMDDFKVSLLYDSTTQSSSTVLQISEGRAVINGHYVESLAPIEIDLAKINNELRRLQQKPLKGKLSIGIRIMYSTVYTMAGSISVENDEDMYEGIHIVILPKDEFKLPQDVPANPEKVTAHLKLADVTFTNGAFSSDKSIKQNPEKITVLEMDKIGNVKSVLDNYYVTKYGLNPGSLYVMSGKGLVDKDKIETWWCSANDSLMQWTNSVRPARSDIEPSDYAKFDIVSDADKDTWIANTGVLNEGDVVLTVPHKQIDGYVDSQGKSLYYEDVHIKLPNADYDYKTPGIMTKSMINTMRSIDEKINTFYRLPAGKMRKYISVLTDKSELPPIPLSRNATNTYFYYITKTASETWNDVAELFSLVSVEHFMKLNDQTYTSEHADDAIGLGVAVKIPVYQNNYNKLSYNVAVLQARVAELTSDYEDFYQSFETRVLDIMNSSISVSVDSKITTLTNTLNTSITNLSTKVEDINVQMSSVKAKIEDINQDIIEINSSIESLSSRLQGHIDGQSNQSQQQSDTTEKINNLVTKVAALEEKVQTLQGAVGDDDSGLIHDLKEFTTGSDSEFTSLKKEVSDIRATFDSFTNSYQEFIDQANAAISQALILVESRLKFDYNEYTDNRLAEIEERLDRRVDAIVDRMKTEYNFIDGWKAGDYVLVGQDMTLGVDSNGRYPTTAYVVVPGYLQDNEFNPSIGNDVLRYVGKIELSAGFPIAYNANAPSSWTKKQQTDYFNNAYDTYYDAISVIQRTVPAELTWGAEIDSYTIETSEDKNIAESASSVTQANWWNLSTYRGNPKLDYFVARYMEESSKNTDDSTDSESTITVDATGQSFSPYITYRVETYTSYFYTPEFNSSDLEYDTEPLMITGGVPLASETEVGGFLNVEPTELGNGYVYRDENGHLRMADFDLISSGLAAYQLGNDYTEGSGLSIEDIQTAFDEYINYRIAFPNADKLAKFQSESPNYQNIESEHSLLMESTVINLVLTLNNEQSGTLNIYNIDSRFGTTVFLNITGESTSEVTINIANCEHMRLYISDQVNARISLRNVELWYDADVLDRVDYIENLRLWYKKFDSGDLDYEVDGMTVISDAPLRIGSSKDFYSPFDANDNHFSFGIKSMTFGSDGAIIGIQLVVSDDISATSDDGQSIFYTLFELPQTSTFQYPKSKLTKKMKVTGEFVTAYKEYISQDWIVKNTNFTIVTNRYDEDKVSDTYGNNLGDISILTNIYTVSSFTGNIGDASDTEGWRRGSWNIFSGGIIE